MVPDRAASAGTVDRDPDRRDRAVHPNSEFTTLVIHPELGRGVDWRYVAFGATNAKTTVRSALALLALLATAPTEGRSDDFARELNAHRDRTLTLCRRWWTTNPRLTDDDSFEASYNTGGP